MIHGQRRNPKPEACSLPCASAPWVTRRGAAPLGYRASRGAPPLSTCMPKAHTPSVNHPSACCRRMPAGYYATGNTGGQRSFSAAATPEVRLLGCRGSAPLTEGDRRRGPWGRGSGRRRSWESGTSEAEGRRVWSDVPDRQLVGRDDAHAAAAGADEHELSAAADDADLGGRQGWPGASASRGEQMTERQRQAWVRLRTAGTPPGRLTR